MGPRRVGFPANVGVARERIRVEAVTVDPPRWIAAGCRSSRRCALDPPHGSRKYPRPLEPIEKTALGPSASFVRTLHPVRLHRCSEVSPSWVIDQRPTRFLD
jgi:hypothetical protein